MDESIISKYEEKLARRLGEIAILIHLARSPEGSHAYEIRSKASDILFENRRKGIDFIHNHLKVLQDLKKLYSITDTESEDYKKKNPIAFLFRVLALAPMVQLLFLVNWYAFI